MPSSSGTPGGAGIDAGPGVLEQGRHVQKGVSSGQTTELRGLTAPDTYLASLFQPRTFTDEQSRHESADKPTTSQEASPSLAEQSLRRAPKKSKKAFLLAFP